MGGISPTATSIGAVPNSRQVIAGTNMTGGGSLSSDVTLNSTGSGGGSTIDVEDEGVAVVTADTLNFVGAGVTATDGGGGVAVITIPGGGGGMPWYFDPPAATDFPTFVKTSNQSNDCVLTDNSDVGLMAQPGTWSSTGDRSQMALQSLTAGNFTATIHIAGAMINTSYDYLGIGVVLRESTTSKVCDFQCQKKDSSGQRTAIDKWASNGSASPNGLANFFEMTPVDWLQIERNGTSLYFRVSRDGKQWINFYNALETSIFTVLADQIGLWFGGNNLTGTIEKMGQQMCIDHWSIV